MRQRPERLVVALELDAARDAVEEGEPWTVDRIAFVAKFGGDRVTVEGEQEGRPLIAGRSEGGSALELTSPALTTLEELARRSRLALGP